MMKFKTSPKSDHLCTAFPSKARNYTNFAKPIKKSNRLPWNDPKTTYESLKEECDFVIEEAGQEKQNQQLEKLYVWKGVRGHCSCCHSRRKGQVPLPLCL